MDLLQMCCSAPGLGNSPHLGRPAGLRGSPNSHNQPTRASWKTPPDPPQWAVLLAFGHMSGHCGSHVVRKTLITQRGQQGVREKSGKPTGNNKGTVGHRGETLGFRESVSTASSPGTAGRPMFMSTAAQSELSCPGRTNAIVERGPPASLPSARLLTLPSHLNICTWPPTVPLP